MGTEGGARGEPCVIFTSVYKGLSVHGVSPKSITSTRQYSPSSYPNSCLHSQLSIVSSPPASASAVVAMDTLAIDGTGGTGPGLRLGPAVGNVNMAWATKRSRR